MSHENTVTLWIYRISSALFPHTCYVCVNYEVYFDSFSRGFTSFGVDLLFDV